MKTQAGLSQATGPWPGILPLQKGTQLPKHILGTTGASAMHYHNKDMYVECMEIQYHSPFGVEGHPAGEFSVFPGIGESSTSTGVGSASISFSMRSRASGSDSPSWLSCPSSSGMSSAGSLGAASCSSSKASSSSGGPKGTNASSASSGLPLPLHFPCACRTLLEKRGFEKSSKIAWKREIGHSLARTHLDLLRSSALPAEEQHITHMQRTTLLRYLRACKLQLARAHRHHAGYPSDQPILTQAKLTTTFPSTNLCTQELRWHVTAVFMFRASLLKTLLARLGTSRPRYSRYPRQHVSGA